MCSLLGVDNSFRKILARSLIVRIRLIPFWFLFFSTSVASALPDIAFVTQPPLPADFATANSTFANQRASLDSIPRGGDLYIRYSDGSLKNITLEAGYGNSGFQGAEAIAVRDPAVDWSGDKILFSMVVGAPTSQYQVQTYRWQLYEAIQLGKNQTPIITKVAKQPDTYNNIMPAYGTDGRIIYVSDRPRAGISHHYPQRDEYESTPTNTGLWSLDPMTGNLFQLDHAPSGDFNPIIDSYGRILFIRWDHLQRDQQNRCSQPYFEAFNFSSEALNASVLNSDLEVFPEARGTCDDGPDTLNLHRFNHFLPWQINEDGTELETLNHIGRHELVEYLGASFNDDPNVEEFYGQYSRVNQNSIENFFHIREDPINPGSYFGINAPEFGTHTAGQIFKLNAPPEIAPDKIQITYVTHPDTANTSNSPSSNHSGLYRTPLPLSDGSLIATHTSSTLEDSNIGTSIAPVSRYEFRLKVIHKQGSYYTAGSTITPGIVKSVSYWSPDQLISYTSTTLWELQPVELRASSPPVQRESTLPDPERAVFTSAAVELAAFRQYLIENDLALVVSRNVTTRDQLDHQQPRNLRIENSTTQTTHAGGKIYPVSYFQFFQGDLIRGYAGSSATQGRRVLATPMHTSSDQNIPDTDSPPGSVRIASDGSMAALVPARRALTWQLTDSEGSGVVRERVWLTFQPGEIRVCASCHGVNSKDQAGQSAPTNKPAALRDLLEFWKDTPRDRARFSFKAKLLTRKGARLKLNIRGLNSGAASKTLQLRIQVGRYHCDTASQIRTDENGNFTSNKRLPSTLNGDKVTLTLEYLSTEIGRKRLRVPSQSRITKRRSPARRCEQLLRRLS